MGREEKRREVVPFYPFLANTLLDFCLANDFVILPLSQLLVVMKPEGRIYFCFLFLFF